MSSLQPTELHACDREPVHAPASIQPSAVLIAVDAQQRPVCHSANLAQLLPDADPAASSGVALDADPAANPDAVRRKQPDGLLKPERILEQIGLDALLKQLPGRFPRPFRPRFATEVSQPISAQLSAAMLEPISVRLGQQPYHLLLDRNNAGLLLLELEPAGAVPDDPNALLEQLRPAAEALEKAADLQTLLARLVQAVRSLTGFERVMAYRFGRDGHGEVVAEDASAEVPSFLGLHYPSSDIPRPVRELFLRNPLRLIVDRDAEPVPLEPPALASGLDLGPAVYRGLSPVHQAYLRNMDVGASMSLALQREGRLWGLIACHHRSSRPVPFPIRQACELLSLIAARQLSVSLEREISVRMLPMASIGDSLVTAISAGRHLGDALGQETTRLAEAVDASGFAVLTPEQVYSAGQVPSETLLRDACAAIEQRQPGAALFDTEHLAALLPGCDTEGVGGLIGTLLPGRKDTRLIWLRGQELQEVRWAGDPREPKIEDATGRLHPRASFALWKEARREHCREWDDADERVVLAVRERVVDLAVQIADQRSERANAIDQTNRKLAEVNEELERFVQAASHDLRAPLRAVGNITRWIEEDETALSPSARGHLEQLRSRVQHMERLLRDLLDYARSGRSDAQRETLHLSALVQTVIATLDVPPRFQIDVDDDLPQIQASRVGMQQVLANLISNAIVHHDRTEGHIQLRGWTDAQGAWLSIEDDGPGIPPADRARAFEMFQVLDQRPGIEGSGLGLSLVRRELEAQGGHVELTSAQPRGTRVLLHWPR
ncbi:ATP-binding protein [Halochromatium sp.]